MPQNRETSLQLTLEQRIHALEDREAVRQLKSRYLACCDAKDPAGFRACFANGKVAIDYGAIGQFDTADALVAVYTQMACHAHMVEMHHGSNAQIELTGVDSAWGEWDIHYQLINTQDHTLTQLGGHYHDEYLRTKAGWKISATRFQVISTLILQLDENAIKRVFAGRSMPMP